LQAFVRSIATLYGVRASAQGGSSSGRTCLVLASTPDTGPPAADAAGQLQALLAAELTREVTAAAIAAGPGEQPAAAAATAAGQQGGNGRQRRYECVCCGVLCCTVLVLAAAGCSRFVVHVSGLHQQSAS
jgi:hypothetical protein